MRQSCAFGAQYTKYQTVFTLWAPTASGVKLRLFREGDTAACPEPERVLEMLRGNDEVYSLMVPGNLHGVYYDFLLNTGRNSELRTADPWAYAAGVNGQRSMVVDLSSTDPEGWNDDVRPDFSGISPVIWETHVKDFSFSESSGIPAEHRGTYLAFTDLDSHVPMQEDAVTGLTYLRQLGVTHIQLQPVADYYTVNEKTLEQYNWGYDILNYNVPEGSYSTDPYDGAKRITELKQLVQAAHRAGIGVVLDVVYNHTYFKHSWLERTAPGAFYRKRGDEFMNASGCGNETASEKEAFRNYMIHSVLYWANEYHVDGFRFDLMGIHDTECMNIIRERLDSMKDGAKILTYGEPWTCLPVDLHEPYSPADKKHLMQLNPRIGAFSDITRNALAGNAWKAENPGFISGNTDPDTMRAIRAAVTGFSLPGFAHEMNHFRQALHYVSCHDNFTLQDRLIAQSDPHTVKEEEFLRKTKFAAGVYLTCCGMALIGGGEEFLRSKGGNGNSYNGPAEVNMLHWENVSEYRELVSWYRGLIGLRKFAFGGLDTHAAEEVLFVDTAERELIAFMRPAFCSDYSELLVCYNPGAEAAGLHIPAGKWLCAVDGERSDYWKDPETMEVIDGTCMVSAQSIKILIR